MHPPIPPRAVIELTPYQPGRSIEEIREITGLETIHKLASNENPLGSSPLALSYAAESLKNVSVYPRAGLRLRTTLAKKFNLSLGNLVVGAGSEGVLLTAMRAFLRPGDEVLTAEGTFIGFYVIASAMDLELRTVSLREDYTYDLDAMLHAVTDKTRLIYIANPNNPTGTAISRTEWINFLERLPDGILVIMDEAYFEYARDQWDDYPDSLGQMHPQVLTLRTFSKVYGLAGMRIGYGIGCEEVISSLLKVKLPFEPSSVAEAAGVGALEDADFLNLSLKTNRRGMQRIRQLLSELSIGMTASVANFILIPFESPERATWFSDELLKRGIIARPMVPFRLPHAVRITIGNEEQMDALVEAVREILG